MLSSEALSQLFTIESLLSLQGAATAAVLVPSVLLYLLGERFLPYAKWTSFLVAVTLAFLSALLAKEATAVKWIVAVFNSFLIFAAAVGVNESLAKTGDRGVAAGSLRRRWPLSWF